MRAHVASVPVETVELSNCPLSISLNPEREREIGLGVSSTAGSTVSTVRGEAMAAAKKDDGKVKVKSALALDMARVIALKAAEASDDRVLDLAPAMAKARIERAARLDPPFSPRELLRRAHITAPLIERMVAADIAAVEAGRLSAAEAMGAHHMAAAEEIRFVREAASLSGGVPAVDWVNSGGGSRGTPLWPSGGGANHQANQIAAACFAPWQSAMLDNPPVDGRGRPIDGALFIVMSAVLQGPPLRELEKAVGIRNGQAKRVIRVGLTRYTTFEELMSTRRKPGKTRV